MRWGPGRCPREVSSEGSDGYKGQLLNLFLAMQRQCVLHHHVAESKAAILAILQQFFLRVIRLSYSNIIRLVVADILFIMVKPAAVGSAPLTINAGFFI